jgi:regulator of sirC expression with transglutaminase-like and TPR domain
MLVAKKLGIPVYGVNLPQHFVLAYRDEPNGMNAAGKILFYINAFNNGTVFSKDNLEQFLIQIKIEPRLEYFETCSHLDIVKRVLRNLVIAYSKFENRQMANDIQRMLFILGEIPITQFDDSSSMQEDDDDDEDPEA